jgi:hypothetical protein
MPLNLTELRSIARGETEAERGRNGVASRNITPPVTPKKPRITPVTPATPQIRWFGKDVFGGVAEGVSVALCRPLYDPEALQAEADKRNRGAVLAGLTDRFCGCGKLATVAVGRFRPDAGNREGVARWVCYECCVARNAMTRHALKANEPSP